MRKALNKCRKYKALISVHRLQKQAPPVCKSEAIKHQIPTPFLCVFDWFGVAFLLLNYNSKIQIYKTIIRPTVTYGCETWVLTASDENQLYIFERRILRKIYGPTQNPDGTWRIKTNDELRHRMKQEDIIKFINHKTEMGSPCNENGEYKNCQKNNRMDAI